MQFSSGGGDKNLEGRPFGARNRRFSMSPVIEKTGSFFGRVVSNDSFKKGIAGAFAGALVAVVGELLFPGNA
jgi:hypothetical protein